MTKLSFQSVSYTHLDVYKRQILPSINPNRGLISPPKTIRYCNKILPQEQLLVTPLLLNNLFSDYSFDGFWTTVSVTGWNHRSSRTVSFHYFTFPIYVFVFFFNMTSKVWSVKQRSTATSKYKQRQSAKWLCSEEYMNNHLASRFHIQCLCSSVSVRRHGGTLGLYENIHAWLLDIH